MRIIFHEHYLSHARPLMKKLKSLNVYQINMYQVILFMYKVKMGTIPKIFNSNFTSVEHSYNTRFSLNSFQLPRSSKTSKFSITLSYGTTSLLIMKKIIHHLLLLNEIWKERFLILIMNQHFSNSKQQIYIYIYIYIFFLVFILFSLVIIIFFFLDIVVNWFFVFYFKYT